MTYGLLESFLDNVEITFYKGNLVCSVHPITVLVLPDAILANRVRNLRTIIVIADIHRGLHSPAVRIATKHRPWLTFRHWSGVTPYTSSYEFAGSCVFGKQLAGTLSLRPNLLA